MHEASFRNRETIITLQSRDSLGAQMNRCTANETISTTADFILSIGNALPIIDMWRFAYNPRILQLLPIGKIAQAFQPEGDKELLGRHKGIGRTASRRPWPGANQLARVQATDQITADLLAEDVLQPVARDRLVVSDGSQHRDVKGAQVLQLVAWPLWGA